MELQLTGDKKKKKVQNVNSNTKACFPILTLPFQETLTDFKKETSQASSHQALSMKRIWTR